MCGTGTLSHETGTAETVGSEPSGPARSIFPFTMPLLPIAPASDYGDKVCMYISHCLPQPVRFATTAVVPKLSNATPRPRTATSSVVDEASASNTAMLFPVISLFQRNHKETQTNKTQETGRLLLFFFLRVTMVYLSCHST